jgi:hypothetical protein
MPERFGHGLRVEDGDIVIENDAVATVSGLDILLQSLVLRVMTPLGDDEFNTTYGLDVESIFTQPTGARLTKELIKLNLVRTLATDPRVREVRDVVFPDDPDFLEEHPQLNAEAARERRHSRLWTVLVTILTVDEEAHTLPVTLVV